MEIYTVTYCAMDGETTSPPPWHACLLLSRYDEETKKLEVIDNWGFYGVPSTPDDSYLGAFKIYLKTKIGMNVDFYGNHGMLRHEDTRFLDLGKGLRGATFELTPEKFAELQSKCNKMAKDQNDAIEEVVPAGEVNTTKKFRIYADEDLAKSIYMIEKRKAQKANREPRLKPFELNPNNLRTCKVQAVELLEGILSPEQIVRLKGYSMAVPRWSGPMERIFLHSTGPLRDHKLGSGKVVHNRDQKKDGDAVKLYWSLPPQEGDFISDEARRCFQMNKNYVDDVKGVVRKLLTLEWFFINATFAEKDEKHRSTMLAFIRELYDQFAIIKPRQASNPPENLFSLFSFQKLNEDDVEMVENLNVAQDFLNGLYFAMTDKWEMNEEDPVEDIEALAACLPGEEQRKLCELLGRSYVEPEVDLVGSPGLR